MKIEKSDRKLIIYATLSDRDTFIFLGAGIVFIIASILLFSLKPSFIPLLFASLGVLTLLSFAIKAKKTQFTYIFDSLSQQLRMSNGSTIPFLKLENISVHTDTSTSSYGEKHSFYSVILETSAGKTFLIPANSLGEANRAVEQIRNHLNQ